MFGPIPFFPANAGDPVSGRACVSRLASPSLMIWPGVRRGNRGLGLARESTDKRKKRPSKLRDNLVYAVVWLGLFRAAGLAAWKGFNGALGANPIEALIRQLGVWGLVCCWSAWRSPTAAGSSSSPG